MKKIIIIGIMFFILSFTVLGSNGWNTANWTHYYNFDQTSGSTLSDEVGSMDGVTTGTIAKGQTGVNKISGTAWYMEDDFIDFNENTIIDGQKRTVFFWLKTIGNTDIILDFGEMYSATVNGQCGAYGSNSVGVSVYTTAGWKCVNTGENDLDNQWHNYAFVTNSTTLALYQDGILIDTESITNYQNLARDYHIGSIFSEDTLYRLAGYVDEWAFFNTDLSANVIYSMYIHGENGFALDEENSTSFYYEIIYPEYNNSVVNNDLWNGSIVLETNSTFSGCTINETTIWNVSADNGTVFTFYNSSELESGKNYKATILCSGEVRTLNLTFDNELPTIENIFPVNGSLNIDQIVVHAEFKDNYGISQYNITIKDSDNNIIWNDFNSSISIDEIINEIEEIHILNISTWDNGTYSILFELWDIHTDYDIKEKLEKDVDYYKPKNNEMKEYFNDYDIELNYLFNDEVSVSKLIKTDKISYELNTTSKDNFYEFSSNKKIEYLPNSKFPCHFIVDNKIWHDCVGIDVTNIEKISDNKYKIYFKSEKIKDKISIESTGLLNYVNHTHIFYVGDYETNIISEGMTMFQILIIAIILYIITIAIFIIIPNEITLSLNVLSSFFFLLQLVEYSSGWIIVIGILFFFANIILAYSYYKGNKN